MRALTDPADVYELHVNLIRHGRRLCTAAASAVRGVPAAAPLPYGRERLDGLNTSICYNHT